MTGRLFCVALFCSALFFASAGTSYALGPLSEHHSMGILPHLQKEVGEDVLNGVTKFFKDSEYAIEHGDIEGLMALYSENYTNGGHKKADARKIWERLFASFKDMVTVHNMRIETYSEKTGVIIIRCTGLLLGVSNKDTASGLRTLDNWTNSDHILVNESGSWKLLGTYGKPTKRLWFDKAMQPLF